MDSTNSTQTKKHNGQFDFYSEIEGKKKVIGPIGIM